VLASILPPVVTTAEVFGDADDNGALLPPEGDAIQRAVPKRRGEYTAVRVCARRAMARAGLEAVPVVPGPDGAPTWPPGIVGSMTHCDGYRACALAPSDAIAALGIDAEPHLALPSEVAPMVTNAAERAELDGLSRKAPDIRWDRILFSAKESVYKAWYPATGRWLGFEEAEVRLDPSAGTFSATLLVPGPIVGGTRLDSYQGRWTVGSGLIITAVAVAARPVWPAH
jgi:enterobactin synthetase component D / holo-[acyl-carrier protein] synthase